MRYKIVELSASEKEICQHVQPIKSVINMLHNGRPATPRSWLYENESPEWIRDQVLKIINSHVHDPRFDIIKREEMEYSKFHEQGGVPPFNSEIREIILNSYTLCHLPRPMYKTSIWKRAKLNVIEKLRLTGSLSKYSYQQVYDKMKSKGGDRFAAYPTGGSKLDLDNFRKACEMAEDGRWKQTLSLILIRSYRGKLRRVDMIPYSVTLRELSYVDPLLDHIMSLKLPELSTLDGFDEVKRSLYTYKANFADTMVFGGDSTKMDDHFGIDCTEEVFDVLKHAFPATEWNDFHELCMFMHNIPRVWNDKKKVVGEHGLASGSGFTNLFETIHDLIVLEVASLQHKELTQGWMIGDDYIKKALTIRKWANYFVGLFMSCGLPGNVIKQSDDKDTFEFLQRRGIKGYVNDKEHYVKMIYLIMSAMRSAVFPENFIDPAEYNSDMFVCKIAQICENCVDHPAFIPWVKWIAEGQKDIIPFAKQKASKIDSIWKKALRVRGIRESYNNEKQNKPLSTFECMKIWAQM